MKSKSNLYKLRKKIIRYGLSLKRDIYIKTLPFNNYFINFLYYRRWDKCFIPQTISIEPTNHCNAKCIMCPHDMMMKREKGFMSWALFKKIIDECKEEIDSEGKHLRFVFGGMGEPLLDPLLIKRIEYIKQKLRKSTVGFSTNAALLTGERSLEILNSPLDSILFSVDGASKETYEEIRVGLKYEVVKRNLDNFFELKKQMNKKSPRVVMQMVVWEHNKHEMKKYEELWQGKADWIYFKAMHNFLVKGTSIRTNKLSEKQLEVCLDPFVEEFIYWNGDIALCCWDYDHLIDLGNVRESSIIEVYNSEKIMKVRDAMRRKECKNIFPCNICSQIYGRDTNPDYF